MRPETLTGTGKSAVVRRHRSLRVPDEVIMALADHAAGGPNGKLVSLEFVDPRGTGFEVDSGAANRIRAARRTMTILLSCNAASIGCGHSLSPAAMLSVSEETKISMKLRKSRTGAFLRRFAIAASSDRRCDL